MGAPNRNLKVSNIIRKQIPYYCKYIIMYLLYITGIPTIVMFNYV